MTGSDSIRTAEYRALMDQARDHDRTSQWSWAAAAVAAALLFSTALTARNPGLMLPVQFCVALGFYASVRARRQTRLIEAYVQEMFENPSDGAGWHTCRARWLAQPGAPATAEWLPLAVAHAITFAAVVFGWVFAGNIAHGELVAGCVTATGIAFAVYSVVETMRAEVVYTATVAVTPGTGLHEVKPLPRIVTGR